MLKRCDAALLIGDAALYQEHETNGLDKIDLGKEWAAMTGLPFVWAVWAGREDVVSQTHVEALTAARDAGMQSLDAIADQFVSEGGDEETKEIARAYLRENVTYVLDERCRAGLTKFFAKVADLQLVPPAGTLRFFK
jgi:predicted solute-binding protein